MRVTHPFHPWSGREFVFAAVRQTWSEDRVFFLDQDGRVMARQQKGLRFDPVLSLIDDADTQARWYYMLKREYRRARAEGRPFENPVRARTLRWRS